MLELMSRGLWGDIHASGAQLESAVRRTPVYAATYANCSVGCIMHMGGVAAVQHTWLHIVPHCETTMQPSKRA